LKAHCGNKNDQALEARIRVLDAFTANPV